MSTLEVKDLDVNVIDEEQEQSKEILHGVNLTINSGEIHAIMGPNGTGKSTLSETIMGNPNYQITHGDITIDGKSIIDMTVDERARAGLFLAMQYPAEIKGITNAEFIRAAMNARIADDNAISIGQFLSELDTKLDILNMSEEMADRYLNEGFSGGEKKRNEILQMMMIKPTFAILDEIDSGLDIDALQVVARGVNSMDQSKMGTLMITHYQRLLKYIHPDFVHIMMGGKIVETGDYSLAEELEEHGYAAVRDRLGIEVELVDENV